MTYEEAKIKAEELYASMDDDVKDALYRMIWKDHVMEDVEAQLEQNSDASEKLQALSEDAYDSLVSQVAERYVHGDYDCNLDYSSNIDNLINEECRSLSEPEIER